ncbi:nucleotide sugar dehydrogenase [Wenzhouxiangella sp. EGI_FJ10305]|uniref:nucleotide sugar dehydrogenase n=1 Tax=Wenzhouxiangella sp. EGI_FJ10305 TaxID=3243768 RepID=UPI0035D7CE15
MPPHFNQLQTNLKAGHAKIAIIGLGYVGLPLAVEFAKKYKVIGFDIKQPRIDELRAGKDTTREVEPEQLATAAANLELTSNPADIAEATVYIVTVPTPIDDYRRPDLRPLLAASKTVGKALNPGDVVIYESTVYPGCTEEDCVPILEQESGLTYATDSVVPAPEPGPQTGKAEGEPNLSNEKTKERKNERTFFAGYSPERVNPGDKAHRVADIVKVTSGSTQDCAEFVDQLYRSIITAGTHQAKNIRTAEAAKVIENTQRDVNIALINELAMLFHRLGLDTTSVLEAAATKWNFLPFKPGLVGGHCIGVDPYYLTHKAQQIGFHPQMILSGRRTNDGMGPFVAGEMIKLMAAKGCYRPGARVLVLGLTFKENCPDLRNTRVVDVIAALKHYNLQVDVHDPWADPTEAREEYGLDLTPKPETEAYDAAVLCVAHNQFNTLADPGIRQWLKPESIIYDLKSALPPEIVDARL